MTTATHSRVAEHAATHAGATPALKRRVLLVDDHAIVRQGFAALISEEPDLTVCGEAGAVEEAVKFLEEEGPCDVAIIDITLRDGDGIDLTKDIKARFPSVRVLVLSMHDESVYAERALRAGARGYIMKVEAADKLMTAIHRVLAGEIFVSERIAARLLQRVAGGADVGTAAPVERLSDRELQVFRCIAKGMSVREIAASLGLSVKTVEAHREHIKQKLNLKSSRELLRYAIEHAKVKG